MQFLQILLSLALLTPAFATPVRGAGETVHCRVTDITNEKHHKAKTWAVSVDTAKAEMHKAGISTQGKTGYPHPFLNHNKLDWTVATCKKTNIDLLEYPVFWKSHSPTNNKEKTKDQAASPMRVVYANDKGTMVYCGVMTHTDVKKLADVEKEESWQGLAGFEICT